MGWASHMSACWREESGCLGKNAMPPSWSSRTLPALLPTSSQRILSFFLSFMQPLCLSHITRSYTVSLSTVLLSFLGYFPYAASLSFSISQSHQRQVSLYPTSLLHCFPMYPPSFYAPTISLSLTCQTVSLSLSCFLNSTPSLLHCFPSVFSFPRLVLRSHPLNPAHPFFPSLCVVYVSHNYTL